MGAAPTLAIDLPLKVLIAEEEREKTAVFYSSRQYLRDRHSVPRSCSRILRLQERWWRRLWNNGCRREAA